MDDKTMNDLIRRETDRALRESHRALGFAYDGKPMNGLARDNMSGKLVNFLADKLSDEDLATVRSILDGEDVLAVDMSPEAVMRRRRRLVDAGKAGFNHLRAPLPAKPIAAKQQQAFDAMFPDNDRLPR